MPNANAEIEKTTPIRDDIASRSGVETLKSNGSMTVSRDLFHWIDDDQATVSMITVGIDNFAINYGSAVGLSSRLSSLASSEMMGKKDVDDRLEQKMWFAIREILNGKPFEVKRMQNSPGNLTIYYVGPDKSAERVFFADLGQVEGIRTFMKLGICSTKNKEPKILGILSGRGSSKERV